MPLSKTYEEYTIEDIYNLSDGQRAELIDGQIYYIRCEMTPTSVGGEQQIRISGGSQSPI